MDIKNGDGKRRKEMCFSRREVKASLVQHGRVFTVRDWEGLNEVEKVDVFGVGLCERRRICKVRDKDDLAEFVEFSGFQSLDEWWTWLMDLGFFSGFLFDVRVLELAEGSRELWTPKKPQNPGGM